MLAEAGMSDFEHELISIDEQLATQHLRRPSAGPDFAMPAYPCAARVIPGNTFWNGLDELRLPPQPTGRNGLWACEGLALA